MPYMAYDGLDSLWGITFPRLNSAPQTLISYWRLLRIHNYNSIIFQDFFSMCFSMGPPWDKQIELPKNQT